MALETFTLEQRPELAICAGEIAATVWPEFMHHDPVVNRLWSGFAMEFAGFQVAVCEAGEVLAAGNAIPFVWGGKVKGLPEGLDAVLEKGFEELGEGRETTAVPALSATVYPEHQGRGLSRMVLENMRDAAARKGIQAFVAPVRPTVKHRVTRLRPWSGTSAGGGMTGAPSTLGCGSTSGSGLLTRGSSRSP